MKRTNFRIHSLDSKFHSMLTSILVSILFVVMFVNNSSAQALSATSYSSPSPLPNLKDKNAALDVIQSEFNGYATFKASQPSETAAADLMKRARIMGYVRENLNNGHSSVDGVLLNAFLEIVDLGYPATLDQKTQAFYGGLWPSEFTYVVNKLKI